MVEGKRPIEVLAAHTPKNSCCSSMWEPRRGGYDPVAWIESNPGRINSIHCKDWAPGTPEDNKSYRVVFARAFALGRKYSPPPKAWAEWSII